MISISLKAGFFKQRTGNMSILKGETHLQAA